MSLIICPECGHENQEDARYCDMCGIELPLPAPVDTDSQAEEEFAPSSSEPFFEEETYQAPVAEESFEEETYQAPVAEESFEEETYQTPVAEESFEEETYQAPVAEESFEEETYQAPVAEESFEEETYQTPVAEESFEEETYQTPVAEAEEIMTPSEPEESFEQNQPVAPISSATILDWDEPEISTEPSTALEVIQGILVHSDTGKRFELPTNETLVYLGKINEEMPVQIDLSSLPDADIISRVHAVIHVEEKTFYLEDAGSLNGTALNGEPVKPGARFRKQLNTGDTITLGRNKKINLTFEIEE